MPGHAIWPALNASTAMAGAILIVKATRPAGWPPIAFVIAEVGIGAATYLTMLATAHRERVRAIWQVCAAARRRTAEARSES